MPRGYCGRRQPPSPLSFPLSRPVTEAGSLHPSTGEWALLRVPQPTAPPLSGRSWGTAKVLKNLYWESTIPASLAPGNYLIRHELLALHQANAPQFYAECAQISVTGSGSAQPSGDFLATIPGYASQKDAGVTVDTYGSKATTYTCPGPKVWKG